MIDAKTVLLASHNTDGAVAAENSALSICRQGATIHHLVVVPDLWKGMMGDDWLNNGATRDRFGKYLETELGKEVDAHCERLSILIESKGFKYEHEIVLGKPDKCLVTACQNKLYDAAIVGSPRPKGKPGLKSRMLTDFAVKNIHTLLIIVPYPDE